jgi:molybdopterin converting factor small subunit
MVRVYFRAHLKNYFGKEHEVKLEKGEKLVEVLKKLYKTFGDRFRKEIYDPESKVQPPTLMIIRNEEKYIIGSIESLLETLVEPLDEIDLWIWEAGG